jgi:CDP-paratose 2-epimerase
MKRILITGGCGFIGCNAAVAFARRGWQVTVFDNLSRPCTDLNLEWLREQGPLEFVQGDLRDSVALDRLIGAGKFEVILHLAGQVAVTTSVRNPRADFESNALGTLNVLEALRRHSPESIFLYSSTNKVYGKLAGAEVRETASRYELVPHPHGIAETQPLDFYSPYGCSKGAADQYTVDYGRIYGLRTVNFRQSCIYGLRQFGVEDQGWVAWFTIAHEFRKPMTVFGTGKQVRDLLFVDDLIDAYLAAVENIGQAAGHTFNLGGGPANALSIVELFADLGRLTGRPVEFLRAEWRPGDQPVYVSDIRKAGQLLGWRPRVTVPDGLGRLHAWVRENRATLEHAASRL